MPTHDQKNFYRERCAIAEVSDIYPCAFLACCGLTYKIESRENNIGKKRIIFIFENDKAQELLQNFYSGKGDEVSASKYSRLLKELKSLVYNF
jgi:hypothetical protein